MLGLGKLWGEFKAFAFQGNMIELAVAVVIGGAFGGVVHSLVGDVIMPTVAYIIHEGESVAEKAKDVAVTAANKVGVTTSQPTTAPTTAVDAGTPGTPQAAADAAAKAKADADAAAAKAKADADAAAAAATAKAKPDDTKPIAIDFSIGPVPVGKFVTELVNFIILAFAVFIMIVKLLGGVMKKMKGPEKPGEPTTRECPECLSIIPIKAKRCSHCTAVVPPVGTVTA